MPHCTANTSQHAEHAPDHTCADEVRAEFFTAETVPEDFTKNFPKK